MPVRIPLPRRDEAEARAEIAARRAAFQARVSRHERLVAGTIGLLIVLALAGAIALARAAGF